MNHYGLQQEAHEPVITKFLQSHIVPSVVQYTIYF